MAEELREYTFLEDKVEALPLDEQCNSKIAALLGNELELGMLSSLKAVFNREKNVYEYVFRYKSETIDKKLLAGDFLVQMNDGCFVCQAASDFLAKYGYTGADLQPVDGGLTIAEALAALLNPEAEPQSGDEPLTGDESTETEAVVVSVDTVKTLLAENAEAFDNETKKYTAKLNDANVVSFTGLDVFVAAAAALAAEANEEAKLVLDFSNEADATPNLFDGIALQKLIAELKKLSAEERALLVGLNFSGAVQQSVSADLWDKFSKDIVALTGISSNSAIQK